MTWLEIFIGIGGLATISGITLLIFKIGKFTGTTDSKFENINEKFLEIDRRFENIDRRFDKLEEKMDKRFAETKQEMEKGFSELKQDLRFYLGIMDSRKTGTYDKEEK